MGARAIFGRRARWTLASALGIAIAVAFAGCGGDDDGGGAERGAPAIVILSKERVPPGGTLEARVRNEGDADIVYGRTYILERRRAGSGWVEVPGPRRPVPQIGLVAPAGGTGPPVIVDVPDDASPGRHRVILGPEPVPGTEPELSAEFEVEPG